jgi:hypothetical protein
MKVSEDCTERQARRGVCMAGSLFNINRGRQVESKAYRTFNFPQENRIMAEEKPLYAVGTLKNFFKGCSRVKVVNVHGEVVRDMRLNGDKVVVEAGAGQPILTFDANTEILYEPWFMDVGSLVFHSPPEVKEFTPGELLKIATENDTIKCVE